MLVAGVERGGRGAAGGIGGSRAGRAAARSRCGALGHGRGSPGSRAVRAFQCPAPTSHAYSGTGVLGVPYGLCLDG